ncbi:MAG: sigma-70 family RNA polymerase sigma factor [Candidatus Glassbacteria bacterium]|nr:sigma-70 family RNA polymerase sigma factor [Candidatus Glassbacteria bacterium]
MTACAVFMVNHQDQPGKDTRIIAKDLELRELSDEELVKQFRDGRERAFNELMGRYNRRIINYIYRIIGDRDRAEDLLQDTFVRVYRNIDRFDVDRKFSTWLYTIATNLSKNELRNKGRSPLLYFQNFFFRKSDQKMFEAVDQKIRPDEEVYRGELALIVDAAIEKLPKRHKLVFTLREREGKSYEEIADILDCNIGTVKSRLNRARAKFAQVVEPMLE